MSLQREEKPGVQCLTRKEETPAMKSEKMLAIIVLILGLPTMSFLTFGVAMSFLFYIFAPPPLGREILGYISLAGPIPLWAGAVLLFFPRTRKLGARLVLAGSFIMTVYLVVCYSRLEVYSVRVMERMLWFGVIPLAVLAVDYASYRAYLAVKGQDRDRSRGSAAVS
jgi:hypothetical protein